MNLTVKIIPLVCFSLGFVILGATFYYRTYMPQTQDIESTDKPVIEATSKPALDTRYNTPFNIGDQTIQVEIADTPEKQQQGLSGRMELLDGTGMVFPYDPPQEVSFWMPDMHFPIDMLFLAKSNSLKRDLNTPETQGDVLKDYSQTYQVVYIHHNVPNPPLDTPRSELLHYAPIPSRPVDMVLEVPAGWSQKHGIDIGTEVILFQ